MNLQFSRLGTYFIVFLSIYCLLILSSCQCLENEQTNENSSNNKDKGKSTDNEQLKDKDVDVLTNDNKDNNNDDSSKLNSSLHVHNSTDNATDHKNDSTISNVEQKSSPSSELNSSSDSQHFDISDLDGEDAKHLIKDQDYVLRKINQLTDKHPSLTQHLNSLNIGNSPDYDIVILKEASNLGYDLAKLILAKLYFYGDLVEMNLNEAYRYFKELSLKGYADANLYLGFMYSMGLGPIKSNQAKALLHYTVAAVSNSTFAKMALGYRYLLGVSVLGNCEFSLSYYRNVAEVVEKSVTFSGNTAIQRIRLLDELENPGSYNGVLDDDLIEYYQFLADKGDVNAQVGLGKLHFQGGYGVDLDPYKAFNYFKLAAESGNTNAMTFLGKMYLEGNKVVEQDYEKAFKYFKMATEKGNPVGQSGLGIMYLYGKGVKKDFKMAFKYFSQATLQGWVDGQLHLGLMYLKGYGVSKDYKTAIKYFTMASQSGHILGFYNLAEMHASGIGTLRSCSTAVDLFKTVSEKGPWGATLMEAHDNYKDGKVENSFIKYAVLSELGYEVAQSNAALLLDRNEVPELFSKDEIHTRAFMYWNRAASQGYSAARVKLGDYYYYGLGTDVNYELAANQYRMASEQQNNAQALFNLGYMYETGLGLKRDVYLAKRYYDLAAVTSVEAHVPVALALIKLFFIFAIEYLQNANIKEMMDWSPSTWMGSYWDLYFVTILTIIMGTIFYLRRQGAG